MRDQRCPLCAGGGDEWLLAYDDITPVTEGTREALLALGNGYLAARGAAPEAEADGIHYPASYVAGVYNRLISHIDGHRREDESIVNLPNWLPTTFRPADGVWFTPGTHNVIHHHVALDLRCGLLLRELVIRDAGNRYTRLSQQRLVCMARPHLAAMRTTITPHDWSGPVQIRSLLDGRIRNDNVVEYTALAKHHLGPPTTGHDAEVVWLLTQTNQSRIHIAHTARTTLRVGDEPATAGRRVVTGPE
jgi:trehalose/maltose hydrolase-like predicted phosphorylase